MDDLRFFHLDGEEDFILVSSDDELVEIMKEHTKQKDHQKADGEHLKLYIRGVLSLFFEVISIKFYSDIQGDINKAVGKRWIKC